MKKSIFIFIVGLLSGLSVDYIRVVSQPEAKVITDTMIIENHIKVDWESLYKAICWVESKNDPNAVGKTNDLGIAQLTPIYVKQVNKILGSEVYTLEDRKDLRKVREMFDIYQNHFNPDKDYVKAIYLHNPRARLSYAKAIEEKYLELIREK